MSEKSSHQKDRVLTDADIDAIVTGVIASRPDLDHCLMRTLFPDTEEGRDRAAVFNDWLKLMVRFKNILGTGALIFVGFLVLSVIGIICWMITLGKVNPLKFIGV